MAVSPRLIRRRIRSVTNTRKITRAMQLVAASKMRRAVSRTLASRRYAEAGWDIATSLTAGTGGSGHPLTTVRDERASVVILITSHRGLAGGLNANMLKCAFSAVTDMEGRGSAVTFVTVGRKGEEALRRRSARILASFATHGDLPSFADARAISRLAREEFVAGRADRVYLAFPDFVSAIAQRPLVREILPIRLDAATPVRRGADESRFEPSAPDVLGSVLPAVTDVAVYQALLEASASEHAARMLAMQNATDAAGDMIDDLSFTFNQARQAAITREISEIAAGKAAIEQ